MDYLLDLYWTDPVARAVARVLSALPEGLEQTTGSLPMATSRSFAVVRAENAVALEGIVRAIADAGADVRVVTAKAA